MILVIVGSWLGLLWLLVRVGVLKKWYMWMKVSPVVIGVTVFSAVFLPLNWNAPIGPATVTVVSVEVRPAVSGSVTEVFAEGWHPVVRDEPLFQIEQTKFQAAVKKTEARLALAQEQLTRKEGLLRQNAVAQAEVDALLADVLVAQAEVTSAKLDLQNTTVRAPFDGIVPAVTLLAGSQVSPASPVMAFLDIDRPLVNLILAQNQIRHVREGQKAEVTFLAFPGQTFEGSVHRVYLSASHAEYVVDGKSPDVPEVVDTTYTAVLKIDGLPNVPPGASGQGVIFTEKGTKFHFIQQLTLRMGAWMNFF